MGGDFFCPTNNHFGDTMTTNTASKHSEAPIEALSIESVRITYGTDITQPKRIFSASLLDVITHIKNQTFKHVITKIRSESSVEEQKRMKQSLHYFIYATVQGSRSDANVTAVHGIIFDFDHIEDIAAFKKLVQEKVIYARWIFRSPVDGVKVLIPFSRPVTDRRHYALIWQELADYLKTALGREPDATPDPSRACFVSCDPELVDNDKSITFDPDSISPPPAEAEAMIPSEREDRPHSWEDKLARIAEETPEVETVIEDMSEHYVNLACKYLAQQELRFRDWCRIGMALYNHYGEYGKKFWNYFAHNPHYPTDTQQYINAQWERLQKYPGVHIGTLFYIAGQLGWKNVVTPQARNYTMEDYPELIELFGEHQDVEIDSSQLPDFMQEYLEIVNQITDAKEGAKISALLPVIASNIGNRVSMYNAGTYHYCNIWSAIIGPSTISRKTTAINQALKILKPFKDSLAELDPKERNEQDIELTRVTQARMMQLLAINSNRLIVQMELGAWMKEMNKAYNAGMKQELTNMFDGKDCSVAKMDIDEYIRKPAFSIIGATTEDWFFQELKELADQRGGFLQRFLIYMVRNVDVNQLSFELMDCSSHDTSLYSWDEALCVLRDIPGTHKLGIDEESIAYRNAVYTQQMKDSALSGSDPLASYCARIYDNYWFRFCILIWCMKYWQDIKDAMDNSSISRFFHNRKIDLQTAKEAMYLCDFYYSNTKPFLATLDENGRLENERKIIEVLREVPDNRLTHSRLMNKIRLGKNAFRSSIDSLIERQAVICLEKQGVTNRISREYSLNPVLISAELAQ